MPTQRVNSLCNERQEKAGRQPDEVPKQSMFRDLT